MNECRNLENVGRVEELLAMTEQMQDELDQKDQTILELNRQLNRSLTLNEKLNSENRAENIEALRTKLKQTEEQLTSETDSRKRADAEVVAWKFKYEKAEQAKRYAQTHQKTVEVPVEKKVPYEKCDNCDRTAYQKAKEKCDNRKIQLEKKYKKMTTGYESLMFLLAWYSIATTLFTAILSPVFLNDCITFFGTIGKGIINLFREFVTGADSFGQLSNGISNSIVSGIVYWLIAAIVMGILFIITGFLIIGIGYQVGKIYRKYCWDIISIMVAIMSTAIVIYFGEWIKSVIPINLIVLLLLVYVVYIGIRCYVKDWREERGYY
jgi:vacuolar-type H+-ATPase subunit I/STV1